MPVKIQGLTEQVQDIREKNPYAKAAEIARDLGCSREKVRQVLKACGLETKADPKPPRITGATVRKFLRETRTKQGGKEKLAALLGISRMQLWRYLLPAGDDRRMEMPASLRKEYERLTGTT